MPRPRFVELPLSRSGRIATIAQATVGHLAAGSAMLFLVTVVIGIAMDDHALPVPAAWDLDAFARTLVPWTLLVGGGGGALLLLGLEYGVRGATRRTLAAARPDPTRTVPLLWQRQSAEPVSAMTAVIGLFTALVGAVLTFCCGCVLIMFLARQESAEDLAIAAGATGISVAILLLGLGLRALAKRITTAPAETLPGCDPAAVASAEKAVAATIEEQQPDPDFPLGESRLARVGAMITRIGFGALVGTVIVVVVATLVRQPCRLCEPRSHTGLVEVLLDSQFLLGVIGLVPTVVLLTLGPLLQIVADRRNRLALMARSDEPAAPRLRPPTPVLVRTLAPGSPVHRFAAGLTWWSAALAWLGLVWRHHAGLGTAPFAGSSTGSTLLVAAAVLVLIAVALRWYEHGARHRVVDRVRDVWPIPDPPPPVRSTEPTSDS